MTVEQQTEAYILRTCAPDMTSHNGSFQWPMSGPVECPDWEATKECGNGLHGFLWGEGDGGLANFSDDAQWIVAKITEWIDLDGKVKFPRADVVFVGDRFAATAEIFRLGARGAIVGGTATAGDYGTATAGYNGVLMVGWWDGMRYRVVIGYVGEEGILPNVQYHAVAGKLVAA